MNIQILNIKTGTIKIKKQLTYTKTLQMALHTYCYTLAALFATNGCKHLVTVRGVLSTWTTLRKM